MSGLGSLSSLLPPQWIFASLVIARGAVGEKESLQLPLDFLQPTAQDAKRLRITNGCSGEDMWIAHMAAAGIGPDPQNVRIKPGASYSFSTPDDLTGTRYWPKLGCDDEGNKCSVGESGGPGEVCDGGCAPPVDSKFEASFGTASGDWVDISLVDGFTLPFKMDLILKGNKSCGAGDGDRQVSTSVDCSHLSLAGCPRDENMGAVASSVDLKVVNPRTNDTVGCYSPCSKFTFRQWENILANDRSPWDDEVKDYCCPTPPESPEECRRGPVGSTKFVRAVHEGCPGVYGYSYDDGMGLLRCPVDTEYHVTFYCPNFEPPRAPSPRAEAEMRFLTKQEATKPPQPVFKIFEDGAIEIMNVFEGKFEKTASLSTASGLALETRSEPQLLQRWFSPLGLGVALSVLGIATLAISRRLQRPSAQRQEEEYQRVPRSVSSEYLDGSIELLPQVMPPVASEYTSVGLLTGMAPELAEV